MIRFKSYECCGDLNQIVEAPNNTVEKYSELYAKYSTLNQEEKIKVQIDKYNVWNTEINSIKRLRENTEVNEIEKLLLEDHLTILYKEAWECREEIYRLYHKEPLQDYPEVEKFLEKTGGVNSSLKSPVTGRHIDPNRYIILSPKEKIHLLISQENMLEIEKFALRKRLKSHKLNKYEKLFLNYRIYFLFNCVDIVSRCVTVTFYNEFKRDFLGLIELYKEILMAGCDIKFTKLKFKDREHLRYPYDFKRPNEVPPNEWGSPDIDWTVGWIVSHTSSSERLGEVPPVA